MFSLLTQRYMAMLTVRYFVSFVCGSFHLLVDPALELIRITEKLLQVEGIGQLGAAAQGSLVKGIAAAQQLEDRNPRESPVLTPPKIFSTRGYTATSALGGALREVQKEPWNLQRHGE